MTNGWQTKRLGDLCDLATGGTPSRSHSEYFGGNIKWLVSGDIHQGEIFDCEGRLTEAGMKASNARVLPINSVLIALNGQGKTRGTVALLRTPASCNQSIVCMTPKQSVGLLAEYLYANLRARYEELRRMTSDDGKDRRGLNMGLIRDIELPMPSLAEQQRIVELLDEALGGLATAKANAEKALQNATALFESHLHAALAQKGRGWVEAHRPLEELCDLIVDCEHKTAPTQAHGIPLIRTPNIGRGKLLLDDVYRVSEPTYRAWTRRAEPQAGDLVLAREAPAGNVAVIPENTRVCLGQRTVLIRPKAKVFESSFLAFLLLEPTIQARLLAHSRGATVQHVNLKDIRALDVGAIAPLDIQRSIVAKLRSLDAEAERLRSVYRQKLSAIGDLKKSLLHQAFSGALLAPA